MHKGFLKTAAVLAAITVAMGAFAAHSLKQQVSDTAVNIFETGVRYQFYHVFALFITAIVYREFPSAIIKTAGWLFIIGILLFSGSLYFLTALTAMVSPNYKWIGAVTPVGGLAFIAGWICLFIAFFRNRTT